MTPEVTRSGVARRGADDGQRRYCAFAFTDIVGYSALMAQDEAGTHARWMEIRRRAIVPLLETHKGRLVKSTGDGILAEFADVLDAVRWSLQLQSLLSEEDFEPTIKLALRISVHAGEVFDAHGDIFGDEVNVAARLQEHAAPGGVVISDLVYEEVRHAIEVEARSLGYLRLKNLDKPVFAYALGPNVHQIRAGVPVTGEGLPSIGVLPFQQLGGDEGDKYFSDGIVEDIIVSLSGLRELFVVSRASTLKFSGTGVDPRDVGPLLGVRYVLTGSLRRSDRSMRISTQLCDTFTGETLWGDSARVDDSELFEVQDDIVSRAVAGIAPHIREVELRNALRKRPSNLSAYDATLRALDLISSLDHDTFMRARGYLDQAREYDPQFAMAYAWTARWHSLLIGQGWSDDPDSDSQAARQFATQAIQLDRQNSLALATFGHLSSFLYHDYDTAQVYLERARQASPSNPLAWILSSATASYVGQGDRAVEFAQRGIRLSPFDQQSFYYHMILSLAYFSNGNIDGAVRLGRMSLAENPSCTSTLRILIAALGVSGETDEARKMAFRLTELEPDFSIDRYRHSRLPFKSENLKARFLEGLIRADLPG